jgi:uncharacterized membrane protein
MWYMIAENSVEIGAAAPTVWAVYSDVERWSDWTASIEHIAALDGPGIEVGKRFEIKQPRLPKVVWHVTDVEPGVSWTWRQHSFGAKTAAYHEVEAQGTNRTVVRQGIDQRGPIGMVLALLMRRLTKRYLRLEAEGLKARSQERQARDAASA